jgi:hypothetical protein
MTASAVEAPPTDWLVVSTWTIALLASTTTAYTVAVLPAALPFASSTVAATVAEAALTFVCLRKMPDDA